MQRYSYPWWIVATSVIHMAWSGILGLVILVVALDVLITDSYRLLPAGWEVVKFHPWAGVPVGLFLCLMSLTVAVNVNTIEAVEAGIKVKVFHLYWRQVLWTDIKRVVTISERYTGTTKIQVIETNAPQLTVIHRLMGLSLITRFSPVVPVYPQIQHYQQLMDTIRNHLKESQGTGSGEFWTA